MENRKVLREVIIDDFSEYIQTTAKIRPKPYLEGKVRLPKKYDNDDYEFRTVKFHGKWLKALVRKSDGYIVPSNSKTVDKPRTPKVNGQDLYNSNMHSFSRAKIVNILHSYLDPYINTIEPIVNPEDYPLMVSLKFEIVDMGKNNVDNDNKWIWRKVIQDGMTKLGKIPDDNCYNISKNSEETILLPEGSPQRLTITIYGQ